MMSCGRTSRLTLSRTLNHCCRPEKFPNRFTTIGATGVASEASVCRTRSPISKNWTTGPNGSSPPSALTTCCMLMSRAASSKRPENALLVVKENETIRDIPLIHLGQVVLCGNISVTTPVMQTLLNEGIPIVYLSAYGRYQGALMPQISRNSLLRVAQHRAADDPEKCLALAKAFVHGKISNMRLMLQRRKWRGQNRNGR